MQVTKSLILRIVLAYVGLGAAILLAVGATLWQINQQRADANVVNVAGRQRMLTQRMAMSGLNLLRSGGDAESRDALRAALQVFTGSHEDLSQGDPATGFPPPSLAAKAQLQQVTEVWRPLEADLGALLEGAAAESRLRQASDRVDETNHALLAASERLFAAAEGDQAEASALVAIGELRTLGQTVARIAFEVERAEGGLEQSREHEAELRAALEGFEAALAHVVGGGSGASTQSAARDVTKVWAPFKEQAAIVAQEAGGHAERVTIGRRVSERAEEVLARCDELTTLLQTESETRVNQLVQVLGGVLLMGLLLTIAAAYAAARGLRPLKELERVTTRMATGDLREEVQVSGEDEVGRLAAAVGALVAELRDYARRSGQVAHSMGSATVQINSSVQEQSSVLTSQAAAIAEATSSLEELKSNALRNDERARDVLGTAQNTIGGMRQVQDQVTEIAGSIVSLSEKVQQIGEILDSVSDIADQSNLLALNASIEASKAGEYGRGFEVVASEVRNLAQQSQKATLSIRTMLRDIQRAMNSAVMKTEEGTKRVEKQSGDLQSATQSVEQIVYATREQSQAIEQIADAVSSVSGSVSQSHASTSQIADATAGLVRQAEELRSAVARFVV